MKARSAAHVTRWVCLCLFALRSLATQGYDPEGEATFAQWEQPNPLADKKVVSQDAATMSYTTPSTDPDQMPPQERAAERAQLSVQEAGQDTGPGE
jgi:hypothetical protein